jgi:protein-S-isoprenylcysteine O-methyltransferase Ste14
METIIIFLVLSIPVTIISWRSLFAVKSHGFYRYFAWECILWLIAQNYIYWFTDPFGTVHIISWILLIASIFVLLAGVFKMKKSKHTGGGEARNDKELFEFEKTSELIDTGIFRYIRHPLYSSLLLLTWGIYLKNATVLLLIISILSSIFLYFTAHYDEAECIKYFGERYVQYRKKTKTFIPFLF